jgi:ubiquinone/menaquinone biosynthesis C-methylase UbiE
MLEPPRTRAARGGVTVDLREADVQDLPFPDASFETLVATLVFCSVPDPVLGLREIRLVLVWGGQLLTLDHVLSHKPRLGPLMRLASPLVERIMGAKIGCETVENVDRAGFADVRGEDLWLDIMKLIEAPAGRLAQDVG